MQFDDRYIMDNQDFVWLSTEKPATYSGPDRFVVSKVSVESLPEILRASHFGTLAVHESLPDLEQYLAKAS